MRYLGLCFAGGILAMSSLIGLIRSKPGEIEITDEQDKVVYTDNRRVLYADKIPYVIQFADNRDNGPGIDCYRMRWGSMPEGPWSPVTAPFVPDAIKKAAGTIRSDYKAQEARRHPNQVGHELFGR